MLTAPPDTVTQNVWVGPRQSAICHLLQRDVHSADGGVEMPSQEYGGVFWWTGGEKMHKETAFCQSCTGAWENLNDGIKYCRNIVAYVYLQILYILYIFL